jgi:hypothetical protein
MEVNELVDRKMRAAISQKRLLQFMYDDKLRIVEPHDYGIHGGGAKLFCYQVRGQSSGALPNWRLFFVSKISDLDLTGETFPGTRPVAGKHLEWKILFASVSRTPSGLGA